MDDGRTSGRARRALAAMVLGSLAALVAAVLLAPDASAGTTVTIGKTAPAPITLHPGDTVTFVNGLAPLSVTVPGVVPIKATALTTETLGGPCAGHTLAPQASYTQTFSQTATCSISYAYSVQGAPLATVQSLLPPLPSPTSLLVTVVQAAASAVASVAPPPPPPAPAPLPVPVPQPAPAPGDSGGTGGGTTTTGSGGGVSGGPASAPVQAPQPAAAGTASPSSPAGTGSGAGLVTRSGSGTGGFTSGPAPVGQGGASVPVARLLAGSIDAPLSDGNAGQAATPAAVADGDSAPTLPAAALAAVVALSAVIAALVRTHLAARTRA